jgi:hypothetical protein
VRNWIFLASIALAACGPTAGTADDDDTTGDGDGTPDARPGGGECTPTGEESTPGACDDGGDNDCDGKYDCSDPDCSGIGECPICGEVATSAGSGITLPDGIIGSACTTDANCSGSTPSCVEMECHGSYVSSLDVIGFGANQTFTDPALIESVCVNMEHSWMRDMDIRLVAPGGQIVRLQRFGGRTGGEVYLGQANDCDEGAPSAGTGAMYCWMPDATNLPTLEFANAAVGMGSAPSCFLGGTATMLPAGNYRASDPWTNLNGSPLNGQWKFVVTDLWPADNGFLFDWTITFNANAVEDCDGPIVE